MIEKITTGQYPHDIDRDCAMNDVERRIAQAYLLRQENVELQEQIDANESRIEELLDIAEIPYDLEAQVALLRETADHE